MDAKRQRQRVAKSQAGLEMQSWLSYKENDINLIYYTYGAPITENPSGTKNVRFIKYLKSNVLVLTKEIHYDIDDDIIIVKAY